MVTYVNDLRLSELATGEGSGTWGTTTNTNLELIGEALGYGTEQSFSSDADATTTIGDGVSDPARAMYFKVTSAGSLTATRTLTIAPNTVSRVMFIENATTGSQSIAISQGSGANVTIATGKTAVVYLDGAGSGAAVVDAMALVDPGVTDTLAEVLTAGNTTTTDQKIQFRDTGIYINSSADGQLDIVADTEVQIATTTVDLNGALDVSGAITGTTATLTTADNSTQLTLISTDADANAGPKLKLRRDSASPADDDLIGAIDWTSENSSGDEHDFLNLTARMRDVTAGSEDVAFAWTAYLNGTGREIQSFVNTDAGAAQMVFNEDSQDIDFRVESDGNTHMLFVDGGNNLVGVGTSNPVSQFAVGGAGRRIEVDGSSGVIRGFDRSASWAAVDFEASAYTFDVSTVRMMDITSSGVIINEDSANADFRVESDALSHCFFVDASENGVGIGDGTVLENGLRIQSSTGTTNAIDTKLYITARSSGTTTTGFGPGITFAGDRNGDSNIQQMAKINAVAEVNSGTDLSSGLSFQTATAGTNSEKLRISNAGYLIAQGASQVRLVLGSTGNSSNNTSNWIRGNGSDLERNTPGQHKWEVNGTQVALLDGDGLRFGTDTSTANALDDYEEGTWSPQIYYQNATDQGNATNTTQTGYYTKIGRVVTLDFRLIWNITGSVANDNIGVKNLPFVGDDNTFSAAGIGFPVNNSTTINTLLIGRPSDGGTVAICESGDMIGNLGNEFGSGNAKEIRGSLTYFTSQ